MRRSQEAFDTNGDGVVDRAEFARGIAAVGFKLSATQTRRLMRRFERTRPTPARGSDGEPPYVVVAPRGAPTSVAK